MTLRLTSRITSHLLTALVLFTVPVLLPGPVMAQDYLAFRSPSGNIHCAIFGGDDTVARCDIRQFTPSFPRRPASCEQDWGFAFEVWIRGPGGPVCAGDTVMDPQSFVLDYGRTAQLGGITCTSLKTGMACINLDGHGFQISRARQDLF